MTDARGGVSRRTIPAIPTRLIAVFGILLLMAGFLFLLGISIACHRLLQLGGCLPRQVLSTHPWFPAEAFSIAPR